MADAVETHFFQDVHDYLIRALTQLGVNLPDTSGDAHLNNKVYSLCIEFFHQLRRRISAQPRQIHWSKQLLDRAWAGSEKQAVDRIAAELASGIDLTRRMTKSIRKSVRETVADRNYDGLLTDWGVHHLHIGSAPDKDDPFFIERAGPLLFVFVQDGNAYLLDLLVHKRKSCNSTTTLDPFTEPRLFQIIHENWPDAIAEWRMPGVVPDSEPPKYDPVMRRKMRTKFTMGTEALDGTPYLPPGGGVMASGHSAEAARQACAFLNLVHPAETWVREHTDWIVVQVERATSARPAKLRLRFDMAATLALHKATLLEVQTNAILLGVPPPAGTWPAICTVKAA